jgi:hypothetical protein
MTEPAVFGAGEYQVGKAELVDPAQALNRSTVDQSVFERIRVDKAMYRISIRSLPLKIHGSLGHNLGVDILAL